MSRSGRLRTRAANIEETKQLKNDESEKKELDTYGLVEEVNGRPYRIIEGLPCSLEQPQYSHALTHALSVKDSAVLYSSMLSSRRTWLNSEMFDMLWSKQYLNAKERERLTKEGIDPDTIDASAAREKMHKLCDCFMIGGPHIFPVRLFILKNDDIEKQWNDAQEQKKKDKEERKKKELEEKKKRQEERKQQQWIKKQEKQQQQQSKESLDTKKQPAKERSKKTNTQQTNTDKARSQTPQQKKPAPQSVEDQKMITNLNLMAQKDTALNSLMVIVAGGRASAQQVEDFKKYIEKARKMPVPAGWKPINSPKTKSKPSEKKSSKALVENSEEANTPQPSDYAEVKVEDPNQLSRETTPRTAATTAGQTRPKRKYTKRKNLVNTEAEDKSMQLTTFQQKYMHNADIVFEYTENPNKRFSLPKHAIFEQLEDEESYLMSWLVIHNEKELEKYKEKMEKNRQKELAKKNKNSRTPDSESSTSEDTYNVFADPQAPVPLYTPMTVKFTNISKKFNPIIINSVEPLGTVQKMMTQIIERGTKLSGYNLWFQLDAYDDGELAESLRYELREYEQGFKNKRLKKQL